MNHELRIKNRAMIHYQEFTIKTKGFTDIIDITEKIQKIVEKSGIEDGLAVIFIPGSTAGVTTMEYESGAIQDLRDVLAIIAPQNKNYQHNLKWGDGNGFAHLRASLIGASLTVPVKDSQLILGQWQQIVVLDFDNRARERRVVVQTVGEEN